MSVTKAAPESATVSRLAGSTSYTTTGNPALTRWPMIGSPIRPAPRTPTGRLSAVCMLRILSALASGAGAGSEAGVDAAGVLFVDLAEVGCWQARLVDVSLRVVPGGAGLGVVAADGAEHLRGEQDVVRRDDRGQQVDAGLVVDAGVEEHVPQQVPGDRRADLSRGPDPRTAPRGR